MTISKKLVSSSSKQTIAFVFFVKHHYYCSSVSLERSYANSIRPFFSLCMEPNAFQKSPNNRIDSRFGLVWFGLVWFYGISTIVGHLMPNPFNIYIKYMISIQILKIPFLNKPKLVFWQAIKWFHLISNIAQSAGAVEYTDCFSAEG